jgi:threonine dehydrogenase-like Zn-dependent dehydrogenase
MAKYLTLPITNLHMVDDNVPDEAAMFAKLIDNVWAYEDDASM